MKIFVLRSHYHKTPQLLAEDSIEGLVELGYQVESFDLPPLDNLPQEVAGQLIEEINRISPDFIFTINNIGFSPVFLEAVQKAEIPIVSWFADSPFFWVSEKVLKELAGQPYYLFICDKVYVQRVKELGLEKVFYLPLATNPRVFKQIELTAEEIEKYGCNISFVGDSGYLFYKKFEELVKGGFNAKDSEFYAIIEEIVRIQSQNPLLEMKTILTQMEEVFRRPLSTGSPEDDRWIQMWLETAAMSEYRRQLMEAVSDFGLYLYGDNGWEELVGNKVKFMGWIDNRTDLPRLYNASRINLNISKPQAKSTLPLRAFDICGCGGFMLTDYRYDVATLFNRDEEVVVYNDKDDLRRKAEYYLTHPEERSEIAKRVQRRVFSEHTFKVRMEHLIDTMSEIL